MPTESGLILHPGKEENVSPFFGCQEKRCKRDGRKEVVLLYPKFLPESSSSEETSLVGVDVQLLQQLVSLSRQSISFIHDFTTFDQEKQH